MGASEVRDIVERLRRMGDREEGLPWSACHEAADEIERLRAELKEVQAAWHGRCVVIDERDAEIERLRAVLTEVERCGWKEGLGADHAIASHYTIRRIVREALG